MSRKPRAAAQHSRPEPIISIFTDAQSSQTRLRACMHPSAEHNSTPDEPHNIDSECVRQVCARVAKVRALQLDARFRRHVAPKHRRSETRGLPSSKATSNRGICTASFRFFPAPHQERSCHIPSPRTPRMNAVAHTCPGGGEYGTARAVWGQRCSGRAGVGKGEECN